MSRKRSNTDKEQDSQPDKIRGKFNLWKNDETLTPQTTPNSTKHSKLGFNMWKNNESEADDAQSKYLI
jgi:hypothetical protein